ncbi:polysaccharide deacetylase [Desulfovibrio subterraneus]|uniref:polysaccharide deacetylase family protein n=1 Tax=Desulfovibrio subterraneus TaxID=2718620 RepID=UPI0022B868D0|nr:polysaccharide deacetylase [Desulfovibrio subterraneus]WBF67284.1 polysaccharide deacetylase [Desulfovibrio subterraneus]
MQQRLTPFLFGMAGIYLCLLIFCAVLAGTAESGHAAPVPVARKVFVLYSGAAGQLETDNPWRRAFAMPGNYFGLLSFYQDVANPLPAKLDPAEWRAVVCAYSALTVDNPEGLIRWLLAASERGIRIIFLNHPTQIAEGASPATQEALARLLARLGLAFEQQTTTAGTLLAYETVGSQMNFERRLPPLPPVFERFTATGDKSLTPWLTVRNKAQGTTGIAVAVSEAGAMVLPEYIRWMDPADFRKQLYIDPFAFVADSMGLRGQPALTPTTLNGKRIAFSHIDADGFNGFTNVDKTRNCAEIIRDRVLAKVDFPVTVSVIQAEVDPKYEGNAHLMDVARSMFAMPNVEPGSHSFSHPFYWDSGDDAKAMMFKEKLGLEQYGIPVKGYTFDPKKEIVESARWITENLAPAGKPCRLMQWSGSCDPKTPVMRILAGAGLQNINGGDTIYDEHNNSLTTVSPLYKQVGPYVQVFTGQANENILTNLWTGPYHAYRYITRTMERTGSPRRLMPINAYYHFYSAEYEASLQAVLDVYDWMARQDTARVFTSAYPPMVQSFTQAHVARDGDTDVFTNYGACLSVRYDDTAKLPDLEHSVNVLGYDVQPQGLFVHLAPDAGEARIVLADHPRNARPFIRSATGWIHGFTYDARKVRFQYDGFGKGTVTLGGLPADSKAVVESVNGKHTVTVDRQGTLVLSDMVSGGVEISIQ